MKRKKPPEHRRLSTNIHSSCLIFSSRIIHFSNSKLTDRSISNSLPDLPPPGGKKAKSGNGKKTKSGNGKKTKSGNGKKAKSGEGTKSVEGKKAKSGDGKKATSGEKKAKPGGNKKRVARKPTSQPVSYILHFTAKLVDCCFKPHQLGLSVK
jgi:hypothetical protein